MTEAERKERIAVLVERIGRDQAELAELLGVGAAARAERGVTLGEMREPVAVVEVAGIVRKHRTDVTRRLEISNMPVVVVGRKRYCQSGDAAILWPRFKRYLKEIDGV